MDWLLLIRWHVDELKRYGARVMHEAALQETKWFGERYSYKVGESVVLTSDRPVPGSDNSRHRGEYFP